jgi:hypothetical protein
MSVIIVAVPKRLAMLKPTVFRRAQAWDVEE